MVHRTSSGLLLSYLSVFIKILYVVLLLCMGAVVGAVIAGYVRIRRHMNGSGKPPTKDTPQIEQDIRP
jgi:hypothetical protein